MIKVEHLVFGESPVPGNGGLQPIAFSTGLSREDLSDLAQRSNVGNWLNGQGAYQHHSLDILPGNRWCFSLREPGIGDVTTRRAMAHMYVFSDSALLDDPFATFSRQTIVRCGDQEIEIGWFLDLENYRHPNSGRFLVVEPLIMEPPRARATTLQDLRARLRGDGRVEAWAAALLARLREDRRALVEQEPELEQIVRLVWMSLPPADRVRTTFSTHALPGKWTRHSLANVLSSDLYLSQDDRYDFIDEALREKLVQQSPEGCRVFACWLARGDWGEHSAFLADLSQPGIADLDNWIRLRRWHANAWQINRADDIAEICSAWIALGSPAVDEFATTLARDLISVKPAEHWIDALATLFRKDHRIAAGLQERLSSKARLELLVPALLTSEHDALNAVAEALIEEGDASGVAFLVRNYWPHLLTWLVKAPQRVRRFRSLIWRGALAAGNPKVFADAVRSLEPDTAMLRGAFQELQSRVGPQRSGYLAALVQEMIANRRLQREGLQELLATFELPILLGAVNSSLPERDAQAGTYGLICLAVGQAKLPARGTAGIVAVLEDLLKRGWDERVAEVCRLDLRHAPGDVICRGLSDSGCISFRGTPKTFEVLCGSKWNVPLVHKAIVELSSLPFDDPAWPRARALLEVSSRPLQLIGGLVPAGRVRVRLGLLLDGAWSLLLAREQQDEIIRDLRISGRAAAAALAKEIDFQRLEARWRAFSGELAEAIAALTTETVWLHLLRSRSSSAARAVIRAVVRDPSVRPSDALRTAIDAATATFDEREWAAIVLSRYGSQGKGRHDRAWKGSV